MEQGSPNSHFCNSLQNRLGSKRIILEKLHIDLNNNIGSIKARPSFDDTKDLEEVLLALSSSNLSETNLDDLRPIVFKGPASQNSPNKNSKIRISKVHTCRTLIRKDKDIIVRRKIN